VIERFGCVEIDHQAKVGWELHGQAGNVGAATPRGVGQGGEHLRSGFREPWHRDNAASPFASSFGRRLAVFYWCFEYFPHAAFIPS
jgi:hypothetical protein